MTMAMTAGKPKETLRTKSVKMTRRTLTTADLSQKAMKGTLPRWDTLPTLVAALTRLLPPSNPFPRLSLLPRR